MTKKSKYEYSVNKLCSVCKYECKMPVFAQVEICRAIREDKNMEKLAKEVNKALYKGGV